jgi:hypothetical protein
LTVQEAGWAGKQNGELLSLAETAFDVLVTIDTNLLYQQNLAGRKIAIVVLQLSSNRLDHLRTHFPAVASALDNLSPGKSSWLATPPENHLASSDVSNEAFSCESDTIARYHDPGRRCSPRERSKVLSSGLLAGLI